MASLQEDVERQLAQWTPLQEELHALVQKIDALPLYVAAGTDPTDVIMSIRKGIVKHGGSLESLREIYRTEGAVFNPDEEIWDILRQYL